MTKLYRDNWVVMRRTSVVLKLATGWSPCAIAAQPAPPKKGSAR